MHRSFVVRWRTSVATLLLGLIIIGGPVASGQPVATPQPGCPEPGGTPVPVQATPDQQERATPEAATPNAVVGGPVVDSASLVDALDACGVSIEAVGNVEQPFLQPESGTVLRLTGGELSQPVDVQVFEYRDAESAAADAAQIGPEGHPPTMMISWLATPHFFLSGQLIVLYVGEDQAVVDLLITLLGPPFAGT
jgi:hypothetical protein